MTNAEIIARIVAETGIEKPAVTVVVESLMDNLEKSMVAGNEVFLRGFGSFILKKRASKKARNISKGTTVNIPAHMIPAFKPCKEFMNAVKDKVKVK